MTKLSTDLIQKIKCFFNDSYSSEDIFDEVYDEAMKILTSDEEFRNCIRSIKGSVTKKNSKVSKNNNNSNIIGPPNYLENTIKDLVRTNNINSELVWTFIVAKKFENNSSKLIKYLCSQNIDSKKNYKIWIEPYLFPTRNPEEEGKFWKVRADLCIGCFKNTAGRIRQIQLDSKEQELKWICIVEAKWLQDINKNSKFTNINQIAQIIEHALLMSDDNKILADKIYFTLITPQIFISENKRFYYSKYHEYLKDPRIVIDELKECNLGFYKFDEKTIHRQISKIELNWVSYEELLGLESLLDTNLNCKYSSWHNVFNDVGLSDFYKELLK